LFHNIIMSIIIDAKKWTMTSSRGKLRGAYYLISFVSCFVNLSEPSVAATVTTARTDIDNDAVGAGANKSSHDGNESHDDPSSPTPHSASVVEETIAQKYIRLDASGREQPQQRQRQRHFQISAHVQTNLHTGYSYFLPLDESFAHLPFLECGAVGSTTESLPLVSGVFRHVPHTSVIPKRDESAATVMMHGHGVDAIPDEGEDVDLGNETSNKDEAAAEAAADAGAAANDGVDDHPKRPSPPKYVVALSSMEITVGGNGNNETQKFVAGDVIFIEDAWWGIWDNDDELNDSSKGEDAPDDVTGENGNGVDKMKGYIMRASSQTQTDLQVFMLTVPNAVHRHWKNAQYAAAMTRRDEQEAREKRRQSTLNTEIGTRRPWWNHPPSTFIPTRNSKQNHRQLKPCTLETDPAFAAFSHPSAMSSTTLSQHFTQHFTSLLRRSTNPIPSFLPYHYNQDLILHVLAQTAAAAFGGMTTFALVQLWWRIIPGPIAVGFGSACLVGLGTWGFVWLGEEISDQWELWRERRRLGRMMSEGWGTGMSGGTSGGR
jgi:hypothetical protein